MKLDGRHVLITGGGRGIGLELALAMKRAGAKVTVFARSENDLADAEKQLKAIAPGGVLALRADVSDAQSLQGAFVESVKSQGPIYGLICAAGTRKGLGAIPAAPNRP